MKERCCWQMSVAITCRLERPAGPYLVFNASKHVHVHAGAFWVRINACMVLGISTWVLCFVAVLYLPRTRLFAAARHGGWPMPSCIGHACRPSRVTNETAERRALNRIVAVRAVRPWAQPLSASCLRTGSPVHACFVRCALLHTDTLLRASIHALRHA